ncbi:protein tyrosine phosphatase [Rhodobacteraceae bacterium 2CG4]|uniref:Protein tyrosine phosphatase n=1 Tax=Halovulum marinum TaxID=2662447 RepID=A0A6L5Z026_9RHOB|nr:sulfur transferase domain-containing protein [Halovulum marinum]MSU89470.1 protein tyrosine phosphatase [Halovulum marinum]
MTSPLAWIGQRRRAWRASWRDGVARPGARLNAHLHMNLADHGLLRRFWTNRAPVAPGVWRSNQPSPRQLRSLARQGVRTILNLRGANSQGAYALERDACAAAGLTLVDFPMTSRKLPTAEQIHALNAIFARAEPPLLMHCKSGADRAGFAAALYVLLHGGTPEQAHRHLRLRNLHLRRSDAGILDHFLDAYRRFDARTPTPFLDWVDRHYDPQALAESFRPGRSAAFLNSTLLRRE